MSRVALYLGALAVVFGAAFALGSLFGGDGEEQHGGTTHAEHTATTTDHAAAGHGEEIGGSHGEAARGPGATDRHDLKLELNPSALTAGQKGEIAFKVLGPDGEPITKFEEAHTKQVHLIVVSQDLEEFAHVHPKVSGDGTWRTAARLPQPGEYRVIADVKHDGRSIALTGDLEVDGEPRAVGQPAGEARFVKQKLAAGQPTSLRFEAPGETQPYLGAAGHLVILKAADLEYLHVHPHEDELRFEAAFPEPGRYVMFLEYRRGGEVRVSRFEVTAR